MLRDKDDKKEQLIMILQCLESMKGGRGCMCLFNAQEFDIKHKSGVRGDYSGEPSCSIGKVRRAGEFGLLPYSHLSDTFVPSSDHLTLTNAELEGLATVTRRIKLLTIS